MLSFLETPSSGVVSICRSKRKFKFPVFGWIRIANSPLWHRVKTLKPLFKPILR